MVFTTFNLSGEAYVKRDISLVKKLGFIDRTDGHYQVAESGHAYLETQDEAVVYQVLNHQLIGIEFLLRELFSGPKSADELNEAILETFNELQ
ncbi:hypothetical protein HAPAU_35560 [Halalkalicoccus paucihalophilus]|uniref:Uncharacterized protein n=1 Tax=Halalkalicoccus paucihalophilus TaxID=1008153 RepID=A0A151AAD9_9EURY|nr:hypothetical protein [Halalkalicoccus paucihalophilus]KYH24573.1 hypothetical protein HAPAU_35560 [Halalkalicoccus paucihalophilus]